MGMTRRWHLLSLILLVALAVGIGQGARAATGGKHLPMTVAEEGPHALPIPDSLPKPLRVGVSLIVNGMDQPDMQAGTVQARVDLRLRWNDPSQAFDARRAGTDRLEFGPREVEARLARMWIPDVQFANIKGDPVNWQQGLFIHSDGTVVFIRRGTAAFSVRLDMRSFPFDRQRLTMQLQDATESLNDVVLVQDQPDMDASGMAPQVTVDNWRVQRRLEFTTGVMRGWNRDFYPQMAVTARLVRQPAKHLPIIFIPLILVMVAPTVMAWWAKVDVEKRLNSWSGSILALVALTFTLSIRYPGVLAADTLIGQLVGIAFLYQLLMVCVVTTFLQPHMAPLLGGDDFVAEVVAFLRVAMPLWFIGQIVTCVLLATASV